MKILVVYYSRTGLTKQVAELIKTNLKADIDEIIDEKNRLGPLSFVMSGKDATLKKLTNIKVSINPKDYDLVIIGTPIWAWTIPPATRTYLTQHKFKTVAFFCTMGGSGDIKLFYEMENLSIKPISTLSLLSKEVTKHKFEKVTLFCNYLLSRNNL